VCIFVFGVIILFGCVDSDNSSYDDWDNSSYDNWG
jgi:hypothetical protein